VFTVWNQEVHVNTVIFENSVQNLEKTHWVWIAQTQND
jgi:hypothetical protein